MSMGYLVGDSAPIVWRGPILMKAIQQLLHEVDWGGLDILVLDLPPGTGDTQISVAQQVVLDGSVIVTTPHTLSLVDAQRGIAMFEKVSVPVLGLVQNMSLFTCPCCNTQTPVFGTGEKVKELCKSKEIEFLVDVPLHPRIAEDAQEGKPTVVAEPGGERAGVFMDLAKRLAGKVGL
jgi:ATP-binding protein involved in chromosome partitioning